MVPRALLIATWGRGPTVRSGDNSCRSTANKADSSRRTGPGGRALRSRRSAARVRETAHARSACTRGVSRSGPSGAGRRSTSGRVWLHGRRPGRAGRRSRCARRPGARADSSAIDPDCTRLLATGRGSTGCAGRRPQPGRGDPLARRGRSRRRETAGGSPAPRRLCCRLRPGSWFRPECDGITFPAIHNSGSVILADPRLDGRPNGLGRL